jgi:hypothetical protein
MGAGIRPVPDVVRQVLTRSARVDRSTPTPAIPEAASTKEQKQDDDDNYQHGDGHSSSK